MASAFGNEVENEPDQSISLQRLYTLCVSAIDQQLLSG